MSSHDPQFDEMFRANYERLVRSLTAMTGDQEVARDSVQEAFVKASARWRRIRRYDDPVGWVRRVAINRSRDLHRADRRRRRREEATLEPDHGVATADADLVDGSMRVHTLLAALPDRQRDVAALYYVEDLPVADIAAALSISSGAVKFHLSRARASLRAVVDREEERHG